MSAEAEVMERARRRLSIDGNDHVLDEVATGRLYFDGEPEVRLRASVAPGYSAYLLVVTIMGDSDEPVGLTVSLFEMPSALAQAMCENLVKADIVSRVEMSRGRVLSQKTRKVEAPSDLRTFMVVEMLGYARQFLK